MDSWSCIGRKLIAMAQDFPDDKYDFKPNPTERSFAEQLLHASNANYFFINPFIGQKPPTGDSKRDQFKTKADVVACVTKSFADGAALIKQKGDSGMSEMALDPFFKQPQQVRMSDMAWGFISIQENTTDSWSSITALPALCRLNRVLRSSRPPVVLPLHAGVLWDGISSPRR